MSSLIFFMIAGAVFYFIYRAFIKAARRMGQRVERARREAATRSMGTLVKDPVTGEYRLAKN